jgi:hypothetical protein
LGRAIAPAALRDYNSYSCQTQKTWSRIVLSRLLPLTCVVALFSAAEIALSAEVTAEKSDHGVVIKIDGQFFTEYLIRSGSKPILWPILGPTGARMTRDFPMVNHGGELKDHVHHRSMWCTHGDINGVNFWTEKPNKPGEKMGHTDHVAFTEITSGPTAVVAVKNDWIAPDGHRVCSDERRLRFGETDGARWIDFDIALKASDGDLVFADDKEGFFALRVAHSICVDAKQGGKLVNSNGLTNADAWGKSASWVDDHGPIDGKTVGMAIFNHPSSCRYPTYWHARTYGLIGANPFGVRAFTGDKTKDGSLKVAAGQSVHFRYRVLFHVGDEREAKLAERFAEYAKEK